MKKNSGDRRFKFQVFRPLGLWGFFLPLLALMTFSLFVGCQKKEESSIPSPGAKSKVMEPAPIQSGEPSTPEPPDSSRPLNFHSLLTKDLNRPIPTTSFSKNDRIYLVTTWTGLQGAHEIKVLWVRPDKTVQETVRLKENISARLPAYTTWAYLAFTKGLLNISPFESKFFGSWKAQLYLDGKLLKEYEFTVF